MIGQCPAGVTNTEQPVNSSTVVIMWQNFLQSNHFLKISRKFIPFKRDG